MIIYIITIIILLIIYVFILFNSKTLINYDKIYLINLEYRKDRLNKFNETFFNSDISINYNHFKAIDGKNININNYVTDKTLKEINVIEKTGFRKYHYQLTKGAVGCYLSHTNIWKDILDNNIKNGLILEDDIIIPKDFNNLLNKYLKYIPKNYDIILLGYKCRKCSNNINYIKVNKFWLTHSYIITKKCIEKIYNKMFPIKQQIDSELSDLSNEINIYATTKNLVRNYISETNIQLPIKVNTIESFKNYND